MIREERSFEHYSRGAELIKAIHKLWNFNELTPYSIWDRSTIINERIDKLREDFDLTISEWHYWAEIAREKDK